MDWIKVQKYVAFQPTGTKAEQELTRNSRQLSCFKAATGSPVSPPPPPHHTHTDLFGPEVGRSRCFGFSVLPESIDK